MEKQTETETKLAELAPPEVVQAFKLLFDALLRKYEREAAEQQG